MNEQMKQIGMMPLIPGEAYEIQLTKYHSCYLWKEGNGTWTAWRASWKREKNKDGGEGTLIPTPQKEKTMAENASFNYAFSRLKDYVVWFKGSRRK
ncbi:hypothetical protein H1164_13160 [Thermoactinomyces daqus]|uniref:Uncharacterized protein n=1 Tax=Thermoactinomyces daqus TaxID=1329516 RepID=A0A7W2AI40_9BACL|nr:hypothetical protein [Thermoactinomyces daqus]MBA4543837.1 hypothetical protein [Thermoactinomyces daqus]